jgi:hypothetical protein
MCDPLNRRKGRHAGWGRFRSCLWISLGLVLLLGGCGEALEGRGGGNVGEPPVTLPPSTTDQGPGGPPGPTGQTVIPESVKRLEALARRELQRGVIAYNPPQRMQLQETVRIEVRIARRPDPTFSSGLQGPGPPRVESLPVGTKMRGELKSDDFNITPLRPETQLLRMEGSRSWLWDIKPKRTGDLTLTLIVSVIHEGDALDYKAMDRSIRVDVTAPQATGSWLGRNWEKVLGAIIAIAGAGVPVLLASRGRRNSEKVNKA